MPLGFRFDALSVFLLCEQHKVDLEQIRTINPDEYVSSWVWNAYKSWCMYQYKKPKISYEGMKTFIMRMPKGEWDKLIKAMMESRRPESENNDKKKVQPGMTSLSQDGRQD